MSDIHNQPISGLKSQGSPFSENNLWGFFLSTQVKKFHVSCTHTCHSAVSQKFVCILGKDLFATLPTKVMLLLNILPRLPFASMLLKSLTGFLLAMPSLLPFVVYTGCFDCIWS